VAGMAALDYLVPISAGSFGDVTMTCGELRISIDPRGSPIGGEGQRSHRAWRQGPPSTRSGVALPITLPINSPFNRGTAWHTESRKPLFQADGAQGGTR